MDEKIVIQGIRKQKLFLSIIFGIPLYIMLYGLFDYVCDPPSTPYYGTWDLLDVVCSPFGRLCGFFIDLGILLLLVSFVLLWWVSSTQLIVTNKRIYGKAAFGKRVDLPIDSVSVVAMHFLKGISVGTSSGRISFVLLENQMAVHAAISQLLIERQNEQKNIVQPVQAFSPTDELKKYKELLDGGVISQEEFDAKKKQLLGL